MLKKLPTITLALGLWVAAAAQADSILVFEKTTKDGGKTTQTVSITGRWLRLDSDAKGKPDYILMDTGRMMLFEVDDSAKSFKVTHVGKYYWPELPTPALRPKMERTRLVAGIRCRQVQEIVPDKPALEHCLATGAQLGLNAREMKSLSRLFLIARRIGWDWPSISMSDERMASIYSSNRDSGVTQQFVSVAHKGIPDNRVKIPDSYQRIMVEQKKRPKVKTPDATKAGPEKAGEAQAQPGAEVPANPASEVPAEPATQSQPESEAPAKPAAQSKPETEVPLESEPVIAPAENQ